MGTVRKTITLTDQQDNWVKAQIDAGHYSPILLVKAATSFHIVNSKVFSVKKYGHQVALEFTTQRRLEQRALLAQGLNAIGHDL